MAWLLSDAIQNMERALDRTSLQQKTTAQNIANVDTPGYKAKHVVFKDEFDRQMQAYRTNPKHLQFSTSARGGYSISAKNDTVIHNNENNVDMDRQMTNLAKQQIQYQALVQRLNTEFSHLKTVLRGGN